MSLEDYLVENDHFEFDVESSCLEFDFPCCVCKHASKEEDEAPCRDCDHTL